MHSTEQKILRVFAKNPLREFSTTEIVVQVFEKEYEDSQNYINNETQDSELERIGRRNKARLHRKLLYHLNNLSESGLLVVTRTKGKGEKFFALNPEKKVNGEKDEEVKKVFESVSALNEEDAFILSGLESYEDAKLVKKFDHKNWVTKLNAILIDAAMKKDCKEVYSLINEVYPNFNDVIGLFGFEKLINIDSLQELSNFIKKTDIDMKDYNKYLNILIDLNNSSNSVKLSDFVSTFSEINPEKVHLIFRLSKKSISNHTRVLKQIIKSFAEQKIKINIQNIDLSSAPYLVGRAGAYTLSEQEWDKYLTFVRGKTIGICFSETSLYVDVYRFFNSEKSVSEFREFLLKAARSLLLATTAQRKRSDLLFKSLNALNGENQSKFFSFSYNYIRLWNYDISDAHDSDDWRKRFDFNNFVAMIKSAVDEMNEFCKSEETIFKSCGIPIRFNIALSSAFNRFDEKFLSKRIYNKITIKGQNDFSEKSVMDYMLRRELIIKLFSGGDRVRFFRSADYTQEQVLSEFNYLLTHFQAPFFCYDFRTRKGELTLDNFI